MRLDSSWTCGCGVPGGKCAAVANPEDCSAHLMAAPGCPECGWNNGEHSVACFRATAVVRVQCLHRVGLAYLLANGNLGLLPCLCNDPCEVREVVADPTPASPVAVRAEVKAAVEEWFSNVDLDDLFAVKGWNL